MFPKSIFSSYVLLVIKILYSIVFWKYKIKERSSQWKLLQGARTKVIKLFAPPVFWTCTFMQFLEGATIEVDQIHTHMRPLLMMLGDYRSLTLNVVNRLTSVTRLFPNSFNDKFCDQMMVSPFLWCFFSFSF